MIDLHMHSVLSDGSDEPEALADLAKASKCTAIALTDHDRLDGVARARARGAAIGVEVISGVELSCSAAYDVEGVRPVLHMLAYFAEPGEGPLQDALVGQLAARRDRNERLVERLKSLGIDITFDELEAEAGRADSIGRPHVAAVLVRKEVVSTVQQAFDTLLAKGQPGFVERDEMSATEAIRLATASGAVTSLAHPLSLGLAGESFNNAIAELSALGMTGMECIYGRYGERERNRLGSIARRHDLVVTGGSDYHGIYKPDLKVGTGTGDLRVPDSVLMELQDRRPS